MPSETIHEIFLVLIGGCGGFLLREYLSGVYLPHTISEILRKEDKNKDA